MERFAVGDEVQIKMETSSEGRMPRCYSTVSAYNNSRGIIQKIYKSEQYDYQVEIYNATGNIDVCDFECISIPNKLGYFERR